jgi:hypothetical protein
MSTLYPTMEQSFTELLDGTHGPRWHVHAGESQDYTQKAE